MKVIFLKDVQKVGKKYETKDISDGYALNFLIPKGLAVSATSQAAKNVEHQKTIEAGERLVQEELLLKNLKELEGATVTLRGKANEKGHLFAGIHKEEIIPALNEQTRIEIHSDFIELEKPIKETGEYKIPVIAKGKKATINLKVEAL